MKVRTAKEKQQKKKTINVIIGVVLFMFAAYGAAQALGLVAPAEGTESSPVLEWILSLVALVLGVYFVRKPVPLDNYKDDTAEEVAALHKAKEDAKLAKKEVKIANAEAVALEKQRKADEPLRCPRCGSTQITANKKGFGVIKGVIGTAASLGSLGVGAIAGATGSRKVILTCMKCGKQWKAGKH